jgi:hypothetical protein
MTDIEKRAAAREAALKEKLAGTRRLARREDYVFDKAQEAFWDLRDGTLHLEKAVDASVPLEYWSVEVDESPGKKRKEKLIPPSREIMRVENDQFVESSTWWPGQPQIVRDWFVSSDGFRQAPGRRIYNQYLPPPEPAGDPRAAGPWVDHVKRLWPDPVEHEFFFDYCAHMVQRPEVKCNAAIVLSGKQGIGKDAALGPVKAAVGAWNSKGIDPDELFSAYRPWLQTLMLVVDEVRPTKDEFHASSMYNILKPMIAAPPDTLPLNDKYAKLRYVINVMRVFITTNDWMSMYIPPEDRRMFVMHSTLEQKWHEAEGRPDYFTEFFGWLERGGQDHIAAYLAARDISRFNPKQQVARTAGWEAVANTWDDNTDEDDPVTAALDRLGRPEVFFGSELLEGQFDHADDLRLLLRSKRKVGHRMQKAGYLGVKNPAGGKWEFHDRESGRAFRSAMAFFRVNTPVEARPGLLAARGAALAARGAGGLKVVERKGF